jgi:hypothetical protein
MMSKMVKLKAQDIDTKLNMINIKVAKGRKDRRKFTLTLDTGISGRLRALWNLEADEALHRVVHK